jgi:tripartite-type tricarboxylate transporter receptor subunit TctC
MMMLRFLSILLVFGAAANHAYAQSLSSLADRGYPNKPIRLILPRAPGGGTDIVARVLAQKLTEGLGQNVVVDNRPGAGGSIGSAMVARAAPDGYTLLLETTSITMSPSFYPHLPYDVIGDLAPVSLVVTVPNILYVSSSLGVNSVKDLIALAKSKPNALNYASPGNGSIGHLVAELFKMGARLQITHIPYHSAGPALTSVLSGQTQMMFAAPGGVVEHVRAGRIRALAIASPKRDPSLSDIPTFAEAGVPAIEADGWYGMFTTRGTPQGIIDKLNKEFVRIAQLRDVRERFAAYGFGVVSSTPQEFGAIVKADVVKWGNVIKTAGLRVQ